MSKNTKSNNKATKAEEPTYDKAFLKVFDQFWDETEKNPDAFLLKYLRVEYPDAYEPVRKILNSKQSDWDKDKQIRAYFKSEGMLPKAVRKVKKATNGKSKAK